MNKNKQSKHSKEKESKKKIVINSICFIILLGAITYLTYYFFMLSRSDKQMEKLAEVMENTINEENSSNLENDTKNSKTLQKLDELKKENSDLIGWLKIEDTKINYPVMQTDNNEFYINHNFKKQSDELGNIFLDMECSITKPTANLLIYGHRSERWANV